MDICCCVRFSAWLGFTWIGLRFWELKEDGSMNWAWILMGKSMRKIAGAIIASAGFCLSVISVRLGFTINAKIMVGSCSQENTSIDLDSKQLCGLQSRVVSNNLC